jgi:5-methylcytosine-specific restriction endonuclease McrA
MCEPCWFTSIARSALGIKTREEARTWVPRLRALFHAQGGKCAYTGLDLIPGGNASLDHKVPKALGGTNDLGNLQWVEFNVNRAKNSLTEEDFLRMCRTVSRHRAEL